MRGEKKRFRQMVKRHGNEDENAPKNAREIGSMVEWRERLNTTHRYLLAQKVGLFKITAGAGADAAFNARAIFKIHVNIVVANGPACCAPRSGLRKLAGRRHV